MRWSEWASSLRRALDRIFNLNRWGRHWRATAAFLIPFSLYLFTPLVVKTPEVVSHVLLTLTAVMAIHLIDRLFLHRDVVDALGLLISNVRNDISRMTTSLTASSASLDAMSSSGMVRMYSSRADAAGDMLRDLTSPTTLTIRLIGISLNDFVRADNPTLGRAWKAIESRLLSEPERQALDVKILLIDPQCFGAQLRSQAESREHHALVGRLKEDVDAVARALRSLERTVAARAANTTVKFECHVYRLPPILFLCHIDSTCYVQQYFFWSARDNTAAIPVFQFRKVSEASSTYSIHNQMRHHFDFIWTHASVSLEAYLEQVSVGADRGVAQLGADNIFTSPDEAARRMEYLIRNAKHTVALQGVSLQSFFKQGTLCQALYDVIDRRTVDVRVLLLNPSCEQAVYRSYRERLFLHRGPGFSDYRSQRKFHVDSDLCRDTHSTLMRIRAHVTALRERGVSPDTLRLHVRLYDSAPACFMLRVDDTVLVEQYHYGKLVPPDQLGRSQAILGKDMPLFEFIKNPSSLYEPVPLKSPFGLLEDHFRFAFEHAIPVDVTVSGEEDELEPVGTGRGGS